MPYVNIVYAKLEKRLLSDPRWYMLSENAQLTYIKLILMAQETYNQLPNDMTAIRLGFKTQRTNEEIAQDIAEIRKSFPKLRKNKRFMYFLDFDEKTNYIAKTGTPKEIPGKSAGLPKDGVNKDKDKEKEKEKEKEYIGANQAPKVKHQEFVYLTAQEYAKLVAELGQEETDRMITRLNDYIGSKGKRYKSHYHTILNWKRMDGDRNGPAPKATGNVQVRYV